MSHFNDCMYESLAAQVGPAAIPDMLFAFLSLNGAADGNLNDMWHDLWDGSGISAGDFNDRAYEWLESLGYSQGDLNGRWYNFWCDGGVVVPAINLMTNSRLCDEDGNQVPDGWSVGLVPHVAMFRRQNGESSWTIGTDQVGEPYMEYSLAGVAAGDYVASFRLDDRKIPTNDYKPASIFGVNTSITQDFPNMQGLSVPRWLECRFTVAATTTVVFRLRIETVGTFEWMVISRPQIVEAPGGIAGLTGNPCTGPNVELLVDADGRVLLDANGDYLYVPI